MPTLVLAAGDWVEEVRKEAQRQLLMVDGVWEIGSPDGTPREFLGALDSHEFCGWTNNYRRFFPNDVDFTVGKSDPARDWYYCQPGGWPDGYSSKAKPTQWRIHFDLPEVPANGAMLTICIAATRGGALSIQCNDTKLPVRQIHEKTIGIALRGPRSRFLLWVPYGTIRNRFQLSPCGPKHDRAAIR